VGCKIAASIIILCIINVHCYSRGELREREDNEVRFKASKPPKSFETKGERTKKKKDQKIYPIGIPG
jgi:hypothetical protein